MDTDKTMTVAEAAERLGVARSTAHVWLGQFQVPHRTDSRGRVRLGDEGLRVCEAIKALRDEDCGYETIRRRLDPDSQCATNDAQQAPDSSVTGQTASDTVAVLRDLLDAERQRVDTLQARVTELSALAAAHQARATVLSERVAVLEAPKPTPMWRQILGLR